MNNPEDASYKKRTHISLDTNKWGWHPSPLVHQIVLVSTVSGDCEENVSPKSLVSMFSFQPPILADGSVVNKVGTRLLALAARDAGAPFYVVCETAKFDVISYLGEPPVLEEKESSEVAGGVEGVG